MYAAGMTQKKMIEELPVSHPATLRNWLKDDRVQSKVEEILREKSLRIRRKVDAELEARVSNKQRIQQMPPETLLKIRAELSKDFPENRTSDAEHTRIIEQLYLEAANNPAAAELIQKLNLDPDGTITTTAEDVTDAEEIEPDESLPAIDVDATLQAALDSEEQPESDESDGIGF